MCLSLRQALGGRKTKDIGEEKLTLVIGLVVGHYMPVSIMTNFVNHGALIKIAKKKELVSS